MADHFFAINPGESGKLTSASVTVATSSTSATGIELRVTDGAAKAIQVVNALEWLADLFRAKDKAVIPTDMLTD
jgi:hypothetical protein